MHTTNKPLWAESTGYAEPIGRTLLDCIGNTPLLRLERLGRNYPNAEFYGKAEWLNPGGSVKDRPALEMIREAEQDGRLKPGQTILDATSGNTGIAYAMIAAACGYRVKLCLPASASEERKKILAAYGAEMVITPGDEGSDGAINRAREIIAAEPGKYFYPNQYGNPANWRAHYKTTANEIWEQTGGRVTHFVAGLGTSGTFVGTTRRLKELNPDIRCISVQPGEPWHGLEGLKHMASSIVPGIYDASLADEDIGVETEPAYDLARQLAGSEGILAGHSSGAALWAVREVARRVGRGVFVTVLADGGDRYISTGLYRMRTT